MNRKKIRTRNTRLAALALSAAVVFGLTACRNTAFMPSPSPNPWEDDYTAVARMENYRLWGTYNVHDPSCRKAGDYYYMYSTDAIFGENRQEARDKNVPMGYVQVRRSKDLVRWEFVGWAFPDIPREAVDWVHAHARGQGATNIWAPFMIPYKDGFRLYFSVSAFGRRASYIGMAESASPEGPWEQKGCVVKTSDENPMNAIDPSVLIDERTGRWWMHYGSFFGGLYVVELDPKTGLTLHPGDMGRLTARRANYREDNLEAPEAVYHPPTNQYYLFTSYDPLMTTYNVRVSRASSPDGPFTDFFGKMVSDTTDNFPLLTAPYRFEKHPGWAGTGHCGVFSTDDGQYFMVHQGRLSPHNQLMVLHLRQVFFTPDGWPVVSPERYAGDKPRRFKAADLAGEWEVIRLHESRNERKNLSTRIVLHKNKKWTGELPRVGGLPPATNGKWSLSTDKQTLNLLPDGEEITNLIIFAGHDWENRKATILFTGLDAQGRAVWGKRIR